MTSVAKRGVKRSPAVRPVPAPGKRKTATRTPTRDVVARRKVGATLDTEAFMKHHAGNTSNARHWETKE